MRTITWKTTEAGSAHIGPRGCPRADNGEWSRRVEGSDVLITFAERTMATSDESMSVEQAERWIESEASYWRAPLAKVSASQN